MSFGRLVPTRHATTCKNDSKFSMSFVRVNPSLLKEKELICCLLLVCICKSLASIKLWTSGISNGLFLCKTLFFFRVMIHASLSLLMGTEHSNFTQERVHLNPRKVFSSHVLDGSGMVLLFSMDLKNCRTQPCVFLQVPATSMKVL